jgi:hypothetical protein
LSPFSLGSILGELLPAIAHNGVDGRGGYIVYLT